MKKRLITRHPVAELASLLLFGIFVLFLLLMLLFSARIYQQTVKNTNAENTLGTAVSYLTTKFRQHDTVNGIFTGKLDNLSALCFRDTLNDQDYITYIYLDQGNLKELFTSDSSSANASAGTTIAQLSDFQISESRPGFYSFELKFIYSKKFFELDDIENDESWNTNMDTVPIIQEYIISSDEDITPEMCPYSVYSQYTRGESKFTKMIENMNKSYPKILSS